MATDFTSGAPIYLQLIDEMHRLVIAGEWPPGSKVPPVRDLALRFSVNPNTMQRALAEMERGGLMQAERTSGRFVTQDKELIAAMKHELAVKELSAFLARMKQMGYTLPEIIALMEENDHANP